MITQWITIGISLLVIGFNTAMFVVIKFNDMKHIQKKLDYLCDEFKLMDKKLDSNSERIAKIEGKCLANHR